MDRPPHSFGSPPAGRVTLTLHGPIGELAAALRNLADALDREQASSAVIYWATVGADAPSPAPGGMTPAVADRFVSQLSSAAVDVLALLCHNAPGVTYEDLQRKPKPNSASAVSRSAGCSPCWPRAASGCPEVWTTRSSATPQHRRYRIEPAAAELLLSAVDRARGIAPPRGWSPADMESSGSV